MKHYLKCLGLLVSLMSTYAIATAQEQSLAYEKGNQSLQFGLGLGAPYFQGGVKIPAIQLHYEYGVTDEISVGGVVGYASSSMKYDDYSFNGNSSFTKSRSTVDFSYLLIGARANYHFETSERFDPYGGVTLGYNKIGTTDKGSLGADLKSSQILYGGQIGANYYFSSRIGAWAELGYGIGYLNLGLTFKL